MVDLYRDINWGDVVLENREKYSEFAEMLKKECEAEQEGEEFKKHDLRVPVPNLSFANYVILIGAPVVDVKEQFKLVG